MPFNQLNKLRESFWKSRKRYKVIWQVLKECCETDSETAQILLEAATMACVEGNLRKTFFLSNPDFIFKVPNFCICDPVFERDYNALKISSRDLKVKNITIVIYYLEKNTNIKIETTNKEKIKNIKQNFADKININYDDYKIRFLYKGLELLDENLLCYNGIENMSKIHAIVNAK